MPYPVPFKLLGDERKGWLDITYLSPDGKLRLSRGNKVCVRPFTGVCMCKRLMSFWFGGCV